MVCHQMYKMLVCECANVSCMCCDRECCVQLQNRTAESTCHIMRSMQKLDPQMPWHKYVVNTVCSQIVPLVHKTSCTRIIYLRIGMVWYTRLLVFNVPLDTV